MGELTVEKNAAEKSVKVLPPIVARKNRYAQNNEEMSALLGEAREKRGGQDDLDDLIDICEVALDAFIGCQSPADLLSPATVSFLEGRVRVIADLYEKKARIEASNQFVVTPQALRAFCARVNDAVRDGTEAGYLDCIRLLRGGEWPEKPEDGIRATMARMYEEIKVRVVAVANELESLNASQRKPGRP